MTIYQKQENVNFLNKILKRNKYFKILGCSKDANYLVVNGFIISNTKREYKLIKKLTTTDYHDKIVLIN